MRRFSRSLLVTKGILTVYPLFGFFWLLTIITCMGAPPISNILAEIFCISSLLGLRTSNILFLGLSIFIAGAYSIIEYAPAIKIDNPKNRILLVLKPSKEEIQKISAKILDIGGAPIHVIIVNNQKKPNRG